MTDRGENLASLVELLGLFPSGKATVSVGGRPLISVNADEKTLDVEADRVGEAGLRLSDLAILRCILWLPEHEREGGNVWRLQSKTFRQGSGRVPMANVAE
jgi:hypothetical protein